MIFDAHCHLDLLDNPLQRIQELRYSELSVLAVGTTPKAYKREVELCSSYKNIRVALGLHPELIGSGYDDLQLFAKLAENSLYVGEIGLDFRKKYEENREKQIIVFSNIIDLCEHFSPKVVSIHSLKAASTVIKILKDRITPGKNIYILHWYTGSTSQLNAALRMGCYFSINLQMIKSKSGREIVRLIPPDRMLLETDAPFGASYKSIYEMEQGLRDTVWQISNLTGIDMSSQISINSRLIFEE